MKKIFTFLIAFFSITSIFAQSRNWNNNSYYDRHQSSNNNGYGQSTYDNHSYDNHNNGQSTYDNHSYDNHNYGQPAYNNHDNSYDDHSYGHSAYNNHDNENRWDNDRNKGYENRYDNRYDNYGHHSVNSYEIRRGTPAYGHRDDRYYNREPQRSGSTIKAVGAGLIVGGIIALMAGSH